MARNTDTYLTLDAPCEGLYKEKMSKFIAFAHPVSSVEEAKEVVAQVQKEYYDARHVCWAYMIGADRSTFYCNDNGEPSGTAGKPILGQINSFGLTNVVIAVVRYFGGIKLGTSGLIVAYREAAKAAIESGCIVERFQTSTVAFTFPYLVMNQVMRITKNMDVKIENQQFDNTCSMTLSTRAGLLPALTQKLADIDGLSIL